MSDKPEGLRYSELKKEILVRDKTINGNTINGSIWNLDVIFPNEVYKADHGLFRLLKFKQDVLTQPAETFVAKKKSSVASQPISESDFYSPFADWLKNEPEECTIAIPLGGNVFRDKWGTPDVIGIRESKRSDIIQFPTEVVSVEIKTDSAGLITAFGQACSYKIFSHKSIYYCS